MICHLTTRKSQLKVKPKPIPRIPSRWVLHVDVILGVSRMFDLDLTLAKEFSRK